jgi:hypothetical protein
VISDSVPDGAPRGVTSPTSRVFLALYLGFVVVVVAYLSSSPTGYEAGDLTVLWRGAHALIEGVAPYGATPREPKDRLLYPLPAVLLVSPLALLSPRVAGAIWSGFGMALIAWVALGRFGVHGLGVVLSRSAERAVALAQWSPLFLAGAVLPPFQFIAAAKPTLALLVFAYRPTRWAAIGGAALLALSFVVRPTWLGEWVAQTDGITYYAPAAAIWRGGGPLLLLALLRWRRPEARLLCAMACVPHNFIWYDQLLLFLVPRTAREVWLLSALSWVSSFVASAAFTRLGLTEPDGQVAFRAPIVALMYLPCLLLVLRRPNAAAR